MTSRELYPLFAIKDICGHFGMWVPLLFYIYLSSSSTDTTSKSDTWAFPDSNIREIVMRGTLTNQ